jgi:hypothetical protein
MIGAFAGLVALSLLLIMIAIISKIEDPKGRFCFPKLVSAKTEKLLKY